MIKNGSPKSRASVPLSLEEVQSDINRKPFVCTYGASYSIGHKKATPHKNIFCFQ
jgi:hypothetical protein